MWRLFWGDDLPKINTVDGRTFCFWDQFLWRGRNFEAKPRDFYGFLLGQHFFCQAKLWNKIGSNKSPNLRKPLEWVGLCPESFGRTIGVFWLPWAIFLGVSEVFAGSPKHSLTKNRLVRIWSWVMMISRIPVWHWNINTRLIMKHPGSLKICEQIDSGFSRIKHTPLKTNMEPENTPLGKGETSTNHGSMFVLGGVGFPSLQHLVGANHPHLVATLFSSLKVSKNDNLLLITICKSPEHFRYHRRTCTPS